VWLLDLCRFINEGGELAVPIEAVFDEGDVAAVLKEGQFRVRYPLRHILRPARITDLVVSAVKDGDRDLDLLKAVPEVLISDRLEARHADEGGHLPTDLDEPVAGRLKVGSVKVVLVDADDRLGPREAYRVDKSLDLLRRCPERGVRSLDERGAAEPVVTNLFTGSPIVCTYFSAIPAPIDQPTSVTSDRANSFMSAAKSRQKRS
jgi:hypothetical protein